MLHKPSFAIPLLLAALLLGCGRRHQQRQNMVADISAIEEAAFAGQPLPPANEDPDRYGEGRDIMRLLRDRFSRSGELEREFVTLVQGSRNWTNPHEWADRATVKATRAKAERLVAVLDQMDALVEETIGAKGRLAMANLHLGSAFEKGFVQRIRDNSEIIDARREVMVAMHAWAEKEVELLTLVDEKLVKLEDGVPKFPDQAEAEAYHRLMRQIQGGLEDIRLPAKRFLELYEQLKASRREELNSLKDK